MLVRNLPPDSVLRAAYSKGEKAQTQAYLQRALHGPKPGRS